ncbi:MAG: hypothetical protein M3Q58_04255 [Bacteroidota bacterium]|nr:hypothetical protein [Bacteroidota bacterium]
MEKLFNAFKSTLDLLMLPSGDAEEYNNSELEFKLEELEGDSHTFFYQENIKKLYSAGMVPEEFIEQINVLKNKINEIDASLWNTKDFVNNSQWKEVREMAKSLLDRLKND